MAWLKLTITTGPQQVDPLSELLQQFDAVSLSFKPASDEAIFDEPSDSNCYWQKTQVSALLDAELELDILLACIRNRIGTENIFAHEIESLKDENWLEAHRSGYAAMIFSEKLCICPSWDAAPKQLATVILDPGLAFGTGTHATTALCLNWLAEQDLSEQTVIDYGCGSGILGLAAARLGAGSVYATDIDPQALSATMSNAKQNDLQDKIRVQLADEADCTAADVLLANILMNPLLELAPRFAGLLVPGGKLALSGILAVQAEQCLAAYQPWFKMDEPSYRDEWALITGIRKD